MRLRRILHAGYLLQSSSTQIVFDPLFENPFSRNCFAYPAVDFDLQAVRALKLDAVFISHFHDDHCSLESLHHLSRETPIYLFCVFEEIFTMIRELGFAKVYPLRLNETLEVGDFKITVHRALDVDVDSIFQIQCEGLQILNVVDSWIDHEVFEKLAQINWDVVLWPFQTMREIEVLAPSRAKNVSLEIPVEWKKQIQTLNPKYLVPSSCQFIHEDWSWYCWAYFPISYQRFSEQVKAFLPATQVVRLDPARGFKISKSGLSWVEDIEWVKRLTNEVVDYQFDLTGLPPSTAEIAQNFLALSVEETAFIIKFCRDDLVKILNSFEYDEESYFASKQIWKLSVYDHFGVQNSFQYKFQNKQVSFLEEATTPSWVTEVPISRLQSALMNGESLSSMYVRVNDQTFEPEIEAQIQHADPLEDPLLRCLFSRNPLSYQQAQLRRLKASPI